MSTGKSATKLATNQLLTAGYVVTNVVPMCSVESDSLATLDITYITGTSESSAALNFQIEFSYDAVTWVNESFGSLATGTNTIAPITHRIVGGAGATTYPGQYVVPLCSRNFRVKVKETGVSSNFGRVNIVWTVAAASGQERNLQASSSGGGGDATAANQVLQITQETAINTNLTSGSQKTQIVDAGGEAATVTGGKLDVNASIDTTSLATAANQVLEIADLDQIVSNQTSGSQKTKIVDDGGDVVEVNANSLQVALMQVGSTSLALGQNVMANSLPVALASDTSTLSINIDQLQGGDPTGQKNMDSSFPVVIASDQAPVPIDIASQSGGHVDVDAFGPTGAQGQQVMADSLPVVIASDQSQITTAPNYILRLDNYTTTADGATQTLTPTGPFKNLSIQVIGVGDVASLWDVRLEGSNDGGTIWSQIIQHTNTDGDGVILFETAPVMAIRSRCAGLTLGLASSIDVYIIGTN